MPTRRVVLVSGAAVTAAVAVGAIATLGPTDASVASDRATLAAAINDEQTLLALARGAGATLTARALAAQISAFGAVPTSRSAQGSNLAALLSKAAQARARDCLSVESALLAATFASAAAGLDQIEHLYRSESGL